MQRIRPSPECPVGPLLSVDKLTASLSALAILSPFALLLNDPGPPMSSTPHVDSLQGLNYTLDFSPRCILLVWGSLHWTGF